MVAIEKAMVVTLTSPSWSTTPRDVARRSWSRVGSPGMPSSLGSWPAATVRPTPALMPVRVASEMLSISAPRLSRRAHEQDDADEQGEHGQVPRRIGALAGDADGEERRGR